LVFAEKTYRYETLRLDETTQAIHNQLAYIAQEACRRNIEGVATDMTTRMRQVCVHWFVLALGMRECKGLWKVRLNANLACTIQA